MTNRVLFVSHGGGPMPLLGEPSHQAMVECLQGIVTTLEKPSAIIVVSAHWEERVPTMTAASAPPLFYDYYGFPDAAYTVTYPSPGNPELAAIVQQRFAAAGIPSQLNSERGYDHGMFVPLKIMYPTADIPCIQLSLMNNLDPTAHLKMGEILRGLPDQNILIMGSGFTYHNMSGFYKNQPDAVRAMNLGFEQWLLETCCSTDLDEAERTQRFINWHTAPYALHCHPRPEHLLPLHVCYGAAGRACTQAFELEIASKKASMYLW